MTRPKSGSRWTQVNLWCTDWQAAEHTAVTHLGPWLAEAENAGSITCWWFVRKKASWRLRILPTPGDDENATAALKDLLDTLRRQGAIRHWAPSIYESETRVFGGTAAMDVAHALFHADSRHLLHHLAQPHQDHRRELGVLLCSLLMRAAGQDWYEQGDIWARVAAHRTTSQPPSPTTPQPSPHAVCRLITARADTPDGPLARVPDWPAAFHHAGRDLAELAHRGHLTRGLRAVLAHHILFAWNRAGIPTHQQAALAATAARIVFHREPEPSPTRGPADPRPARLPTVTTDTISRDPAQLRAALADHIHRLGTFATPRVEAAFRTVPRHLFLPDVDLQTAYAPRVVVTKRADDGTAISSASSPNVVATMLEQLDVHPGHRVLEIGAGTGINAALLAELTGPTGHVTTVDIDEVTAAGARRGLDAAGYHEVEVACADGANGHPASAQYDRIIVTAAARDITTAWWQQLATGGRLVVPLLLHGSGLTRSIAFDLPQPDRMVAASAKVCGFVPLRGTATAPTAHALPLADDVALNPDTRDLDDETTPTQALTHTPYDHWTGITIGDHEPVEHLDLWLATTTSGFARLSAGPQARDSGLVAPALRWAGAALHRAGTLAYLTVRPHSNDSTELGVIAHGPHSAQLAVHTADLLHHWNHERPTQLAITAHPADTPDDQLPDGHRLDRPNTRVIIHWRRADDD